MSVTEKIVQLSSLKGDMADLLTGKGVSASAGEGYSTLIPKISQVDAKGALETVEAFVNRTVTNDMANQLSYPNGIGSYAFAYCSNVNNFDFIGKGFATTGSSTDPISTASQLKKIREGAFAGTTLSSGFNLEYFYLGNSGNGNLGNYAFKECSIKKPMSCYITSSRAGNEVFIPKGLFQSAKGNAQFDITFGTGTSTLSIGSYAFEGCSYVNIYNLYLSGSLNIGEGAFRGCKSVTFNVSSALDVAFISNYAFQSCSYVNIRGMSGRALYVFENAFEGCDNVAGLGTPSAIYLQEGAFKGANVTQPVVALLQSRCYSIPDNCFENATLSISTTVEFGSLLSQIRSNAFKNASITGGFSFTNSINLEERAFYSARNMKEVIFAGSSMSSIPYECFKSCASLSNVEVGKSCQITTIETNAFENCINLSNVEFTPNPSNPAKIYPGAFKNVSPNCQVNIWYSQSFFTSEGYPRYSTQTYSLPTLLSPDAFDSSTTVCVPMALYAAYKSATNWGTVNLSHTGGGDYQGCASVKFKTISYVTKYLGFSHAYLEGATSIGSLPGINNVRSTAYNYYLTDGQNKSILLDDYFDTSTEIPELYEAFVPGTEWYIKEVTPA